jgi:hypothetical protein
MSQPATSPDPAFLPPRAEPASAWGPWLAFLWLALVVLAAVAELAGWEDLRLALTFS